MYSYITSGTIFGIEGRLIRVEADVSDGLPGYYMVGCLSETVRESNHRIRTALRNTGFVMPPKKIVVNLSPADLHKNGSGFDLPIAVAVLVAIGVLKQSFFDGILVVGELGLNGDILPIKGILPICDQARSEGFHTIILPKENCKEAKLLPDVRVVGAGNLKELVEICKDRTALDSYAYVENALPAGEEVKPEADFADLKGQPMIRRAMEVAVAGMHNLLMTGPPGAGKTMAAKCLVGIMPDLTFEEQIELTKIYSVKGLLMEEGGVIKHRPFRAPHHTISSVALIGGGATVKPGEISLAHHGVLFLDELPEFGRNVIEVLRQPLEDGKVTIGRAKLSYVFPADFMLVAAMNPCPCGCYPDRNKCRCTDLQIQKYQSRISRAILDRMDLSLQIRPLSYEEITSEKKEECSAAIKERIEKVREIQRERYRNEGIMFNSQLSPKGIETYCGLDPKGQDFVRNVFQSNQISARAYHRLLRLSRTIADLDGSDTIRQEHLCEAAAYRFMDRREEVEAYDA